MICHIQTFGPFFLALTILTIVSVKSSDFLPSGWTAHSSQGKTYYYNQRTGTSQWEKPLSTQAVNFHQNSQTQHGQMAAASSSNIWIDRTGYQQQQNTGKTPHLNPSVQQSIYVEQRMNDSTISLDNERADAAWTTQRSQSATANRQPQSYKPSNGVASATDHSTASSVLTEYQLVSESAGNISAPHISSSPEHPAFVIRDDVYFNGSSVEQTISSIDASSNSQRLIAEIEEAGKQIVDLNIMIEGLEAEKETLLQIVKSGEDTVNNITQSLQSTSEMQKIIDSKALSEMELRATSLQEELKIRQEELETLKVGKESLEVDLNLIKISNLALTATLVEIKSNLTSQSLELRVSAGRLVEQEKELSEAYKEIGQLEDDMKNIAEPSLRRLRQPSFISRILENAFPVWSKGTNSSGGKRVKGQSPVATAESMRTLNRTVDSLRENLTAIAAAMEGKEALIEELLNQLAERVEEADNRREAYAALKAGVDGVQEDNEKLEEDIAARDLELAEHSTQLLKAIEASDKLRDLLRESEETLLRCKETSGEDYAKYAVSVSLFDQQLQTSISKCESKEVQVTELRISLQSHEAAEQVLTTQLCNLKSQLAEYLRREKEQAEAKNLGEHLRKEQSKRKPWFLFFWPF